MKLKITQDYPGLGNVTLAVLDFHYLKTEKEAKAMIEEEWDIFKSGEPESDSQFYEWLEKRGFDVSEEEEMWTLDVG